jgi:hypothetical protein
MCGFGIVMSLENQLYLPAMLCACSLVFMLAWGYALFRLRFKMFDYVDEVWDCETHLLIKNGDVEEKIRYEDCLEANVGRHHMTVTFKRPTKLGTEILFMPPVSMIPFTPSPAVGQLLARIEAARRKLP